MEFWAAEVKSGQPLLVELGEDKVLHLSQACLGEMKNVKNETVCLHVIVDGKKLVLGTLNSERLPQQMFDLVFDRDFTLSHNWKNGSVFFYGYKADQPYDEPYPFFQLVLFIFLNIFNLLFCLDSEEDIDAISLPVPNGRREENKVADDKKDNKQKVKIVEPLKAESESDSEDDSMSGSSDEDDEGSESDDSSDEEEETPKKQQSGKKRPNESAIKTPANEKKAKTSTPQKTDGKKGAVHVATPHPAKGKKTPANKESPASTSGGAHCQSCNRTFKSDGALQSHNQAKHK
ncbi:histone deacetylase HDT1-like [Bidens hawaiensis]|uniref:histone deacetylase HDT1-like n=1 Tax=Bidens hawaiensis TaxID=980011 RepID=UPI00404B21AC